MIDRGSWIWVKATGLTLPASGLCLFKET